MKFFSLKHFNTFLTDGVTLSKWQVPGSKLFPRKNKVGINFTIILVKNKSELKKTEKDSDAIWN